MKKLITVLLIMAMTMSLLAGCKKNDNEDIVQDPNVVTEGNLNEDDVTDTDVGSDKVTDTDTDIDTHEGGENTDTDSTTKNDNSNVSSDSVKKDAPKGTPAEIIEKIYGKKSVDLPLMTMDIDLNNADSLKSATGLTSAKKVKAAAYSEAKIGSQAYSLVVVRLKDKKDAETVAEEMINGIDQRKWICVEADDLRVAAYGDLVMLFMVDSQMSDVVTSRQIVDAFKTVCGGSLDISIK